MKNIKDFYNHMRQVEQDYSTCKLIDEVLDGKKRGYIGDASKIFFLINAFNLPINNYKNGVSNATFFTKKNKTTGVIDDKH